MFFLISLRCLLFNAISSIQTGTQPSWFIIFINSICQKARELFLLLFNRLSITPYHTAERLLWGRKKIPWYLLQRNRPASFFPFQFHKIKRPAQPYGLRGTRIKELKSNQYEVKKNSRLFRKQILCFQSRLPCFQFILSQTFSISITSCYSIPFLNSSFRCSAFFQKGVGRPEKLHTVRRKFLTREKYFSHTFPVNFSHVGNFLPTREKFSAVRM